MKKIHFITIVTLVACFTACKRSENPFPANDKASVYPADVIDKWLTLQIRLFKDATGIANGAFARPFAYSGITAYESLDPGKSSWATKYNGLSGLPETDKFKKYYWPASVNAALAAFNRSFFTTANSNATDLAAIDSLEQAINKSFAWENAQVLQRSASFGKSIAGAIFSWSTTDGFAQNNVLPYTPPVGPGLWVPTPPAFAVAVGPFWKNDRAIISGSDDHAQPPAPLPYSADPSSPFFAMVNDLYLASKSLTADQKAWALFWRDVPGVTTPGHWVSIIRQVIQQTNSRLDKAALTYALVGICMYDANTSVMRTKYTYNLLRPVTYIRRVMGDTSWLSFIATPAHPEYSSAHSVVSSAAAEALTALYGNIGTFTDHTYDYLGFAPRSFATFRDIAVDAGNSRFYGGIHYQPSINTGLIQGKTVADNILETLLTPSSKTSRD